VNKCWKETLQELGRNPYEEQSILNALTKLTQLDGVAVKTASVLLTAWNPAEFGVMDYKVLEVLGMQQSDSARNYILYRNQLLELRRQYKELDKCGLRQIELALWHYHSIQQMGWKKRPR
jgi:endonuclease III